MFSLPSTLIKNLPPLIFSTILASLIGGEASGVKVDGQVMASFQRMVFCANAGMAVKAISNNATSNFEVGFIHSSGKS